MSFGAMARASRARRSVARAGRAWILPLFFPWSILAAAPLPGQTLLSASWTNSGADELRRGCLVSSPGSSRCEEFALSALMIPRLVGFFATGGAPLPGSAGTLGRRVKAPRVSIYLAPAMAFGGALDHSRGPAQAARQSAMGLGIRLGAAAGLLEGFQLPGSTTGFLSLDLLAAYGSLWLPAHLEGGGGRVDSFGGGVRLGILRESFTMPGIAVSAGRHWHSGFGAGLLDGGDAGELRDGLRTTTLRATFGKNWFVLGIMAGAGWDLYGSSPVLRLSALETTTGEVSSKREVYFLSLWYNLLIFQLSGEAGFGTGTARPFPVSVPELDPREGSWYGSLGGRVTF